MNNPIITTQRLTIVSPSNEDTTEFLRNVEASKEEHKLWVSPPETADAYNAYLESARLPNMACFFVKEKQNNGLVGVININHIITGAFQCGFLGFYRFAGYEQQGFMQEALDAIINYAFYQLELHRLEANVQPDNTQSKNLLERCGFVLEGFSKHYLKINGIWCDHERFAITKERLQDFYIEKANQREKPWEADFVLSNDDAKENIQPLLPTPITSITLHSEGWDNYVYLVNGTILFRIPRRYIAIPLIENENRILSLIQEDVNLSIPNPSYCGFGKSDYPYPIQGYQMLDGEPAEHLSLTEQDRASNVDAFAHFLKALHAIPMTTLLAHDIGPQVFNRGDASLMANQIQQRVKQLTALDQVSLNEDKINALVQAAKEAKLHPEENCLVHGDLYCRHFLFDKSTLTGVIDWGDAGINHPAIDLAALYCFFPESAHETFYSIYGDVSLSTRRYAKFLGAYSAIACLDYAIHSGNTPLEEEARCSLSMLKLL